MSIDTVAITPGDRLLKIAELSDSELPLVGDLQWSDAALGWVAAWSSRRTGGATSGPSAASIMTKHFGTPFGARRGCYLAMANPCKDPAFKINAKPGPLRSCALGQSRQERISE